jgi:hypothetical protein
MLATTLRGDSDLANSSDKVHFSELLHRPGNMFWCARSEVVRGNLGHANVVTQNCQQPKRDLNTPDSSLNHNLVHLLLDELHWHDMANSLIIMPKSENSR